MLWRLAVSLAVLSVAGFVAVTVVNPKLVQLRRAASSNVCILNLRQIDGGKQLWAFEKHKATNAVPTWEDLRPYVSRDGKGKIPTCPDGGIYKPGRLDAAPTCTYPGHVLPP